ncbi:MAG: DUF91 domain-containing protein [SAR324 cluster bacterium]|nr:DUF91 domain-containing protein [SAR324 cluster bacterium]
MPQVYEKTAKELVREEIISILQEKPEFSREELIQRISAKYPDLKRPSLTTVLAFYTTNAKARVNYGTPDDTADLLFQVDGLHFRAYQSGVDPVPIRKQSTAVTEHSPAFEKDVRTLIADNLTVIHPNLKLYDKDGKSGLEYPIQGYFIDILGLQQSGKGEDLVVVEVKLKPSDRIVGQLARYLTLVEQHIAQKGQKVQGVVVCREIAEEVLLALTRLGVSVYRYSMSIVMEKQAFPVHVEKQVA